MDPWQFLIQKEGDRTWHPLLSSPLEMAEGKYRLLASASRPNLEVEIRIAHYSLESAACPVEVKTHCRRTNPAGLLLVLPFTDLRPGSWRIGCRGDVLSELFGDGWQETVQIEVLPAVQPEPHERNPGDLTAPSGQVETSDCHGSGFLEGEPPPAPHFNEAVTTPPLSVNYTIELANVEDCSSRTLDLCVRENATACSLDLNLPNLERMRKSLQLAPTPGNPFLPPKLTGPANLPSKSLGAKSPQLPQLS